MCFEIILTYSANFGVLFEQLIAQSNGSGIGSGIVDCTVDSCLYIDIILFLRLHAVHLVIIVVVCHTQCLRKERRPLCILCIQPLKLFHGPALILEKMTTCNIN